MGNQLKLHDGMPKYFSFDEVKIIIAQLNTIFKQNQSMLKIRLILNEKQFKYRSRSWKQSTILGTLEPAETSSPQKFRVLITLRQMFKLYLNMKHFQKDPLEPTILTPNQQKCCCICLQKSPKMMLPCSHQYCSSCIEIHIMEVDEKKCPKCRRLWQCEKQVLQKQIYTIVEDENLHQDLRKIVLDILKDGNEKEVKKVRERVDSI